MGQWGWNPRHMTALRDNIHVTSDIPMYFDAQFPLHYIFYRLQYLMVESNHSSLDAIELGYLYYIFIFPIPIWIFAYRHLGGGFLPFISSAMFMILSYPFVRSRYVPQFFALIILLYLFSIGIQKGKRWILISLLLFIALSLAHPLLYVYYLIPVLIFPVVKGFWSSLPVAAGTKHSSFVRLSIRGISNFKTLVLSTIHHTIKHTQNIRWIQFTLLLLVVYTTLLVYRFIMIPTYIITGFVSVPDADHSGSVLSRIIEFDFETRGGETEVQPIYEITNQTISSLTTQLGTLLLVFLVVILAISSLARKHDDYNPFHISIFVCGFLHFSVGLVASIEGQRALQIVFLPFILSAPILLSDDKVPFIDRFTIRRVSVVVLAIILVSAMVLPATSLNSQELRAGDRTLDYQTEVAGEKLEGFGYDTVIETWRANHYPTDTYNTNNHIYLPDILVGVEDSQDSTYEPQEGDHIKYDHQMYYQAKYHKHTCNFGEQNTIYNNGNKIKIVGSKGLECLPEN
ncbi:hypothetical protein OB955_22060 [Halobacteria archaeon AArc-m2/3/4]|uniref:Glycosyltransferase RgtA/B/C/D-like domain-containing protein n=1 Tax=Natronoglomus mannanivorans TaxID=2979990 RepID=A0ABT2QKD8_9EURY|nr:hypothetical protein [Halobacteria archaeon AArc-m2/3/4]